MNETKHNQNTHRAGGEQVCVGESHYVGFDGKGDPNKITQKAQEKSKLTDTGAFALKR